MEKKKIIFIFREKKKILERKGDIIRLSDIVSMNVIKHDLISKVLMARKK